MNWYVTLAKNSREKGYYDLMIDELSNFVVFVLCKYAYANSILKVKPINMYILV